MIARAAKRGTRRAIHGLYAPNYPIETERLRLRPFTRGDVDAVFAYRSAPDVARYPVRRADDPRECTEAVQARVGQIAFAGEGDKIVLAVELRALQPVIGEVSLIWRDATVPAGARSATSFIPDFHGQRLCHGGGTGAAADRFRGRRTASDLCALRRRATPHRGE